MIDFSKFEPSLRLRTLKSRLTPGSNHYGALVNQSVFGVLAWASPELELGGLLLSDRLWSISICRFLYVDFKNWLDFDIQ